MSSQRERPANQPPQEIQLDGMDPMVLLDHLGAGWSLDILGDYRHPDQYSYYVKQGWRSKLWEVNLDNKNGLIKIQGPQVKETLGMARAALVEGGNVVFISNDSNGSYTFENPNKPT